MSKTIHPWFRVFLVFLLVTVMSTQPPKSGYSRDVQPPVVAVEPVMTIFKDEEITKLVDSANQGRQLMAENDKHLKDGTVIISRQVLLIEEQSKLIDSLERIKNK